MRGTNFFFFRRNLSSMSLNMFKCNTNTWYEWWLCNYYHLLCKYFTLSILYQGQGLMGDKPFVRLNWGPINIRFLESNSLVHVQCSWYKTPWYDVHVVVSVTRHTGGGGISYVGRYHLPALWPPFFRKSYIHWPDFLKISA